MSAARLHPNQGFANDTFSSAKTSEVDALRFNDKDLDVVGTLEYGQFGVVGVAATF